MIRFFKRNVLIKTYTSSFRILNSKQKKKTFFLLIGTLIIGLIEIVGLAAILPVLYILTTPDVLVEEGFIHSVYMYTGLEKQPFILLLLAGLVLVFSFKNVMGVLFTKFQTQFAYGIATDFIEKQMNKYLLRKKFLFFLNTNSNVILRDVIIIPTDFSNLVLIPLLMLTNELVIFCFIFFGFAIYDIRLVFFLLATVIPISLLFIQLTRKKIHAYGEEKNRLRPITYQHVFEAIHGYIDVKMSNKEDRFVQKTKEKCDAYHTVLSNSYVLQNIPVRIIEFSAILGIVTLSLFTLLFPEQTSELLVLLIVFATAAYRIMPSVNRITNYTVTIRGAQYVFDTLNPEIHHSYEAITPQQIPFEKEVSLKKISFTYPEKTTPAIDELSLTIQKGEIIGFIGESGCGKTTLAKIILKLLEPSKGNIYVDGQKLSKAHHIDWNNKIAFVRQDYYLLDSSLAENIAFGEEKENIDPDRLSDAIQKAQLSDLVDTLEDDVWTQVGEFGGKLSGGQRQRIAIARAIYKNASILVFDEATSSLDNQTEKHIMDTIYGLSTLGLTIIIIAHRLSTLQQCQRIIQLKEGKISREMAYEELIKETMTE